MHIVLRCPPSAIPKGSSSHVRKKEIRIYIGIGVDDGGMDITLWYVDHHGPCTLPGSLVMPRYAGFTPLCLSLSLSFSLSPIPPFFTPRFYFHRLRTYVHHSLLHSSFRPDVVKTLCSSGAHRSNPISPFLLRRQIKRSGPLDKCLRGVLLFEYRSLRVRFEIITVPDLIDR